MEEESWRWIWLIAAVGLALAEIGVPGTFFMLSFAVGALAAAIAAFAGAAVAAQWILFLVVTVIALALLIPIGRRINSSHVSTPSGAERLIGLQAVVSQTIPAGPAATGQVRVEREEWRAEHSDGAEIAVGTLVRVVRVEGTRLVVEEV